MQTFWESLSLLQQILYCIAIPATFVLILQIILLFLGFGQDGAAVNPSDTSGLELPDIDMDLTGEGLGDVPIAATMDTPSDGTMDGSSLSDFGTMRLFTLQGIIAFLCVFGWSGIAFSRTRIPATLFLLLAAMLGFLFMFLVALIARAMGKLTDDGSIQMHSALGRTGTVYLTIPAKGNGHGKVNITISGQLKEYDAITDSEIPIRTGSQIRVIDIRGDVVLVEADE